ncbi:TPR repeat family protein [Rickettsia endosymbiont of Ixodes pacificus]|nr:hypothetical protein [Rickettsia endosymbiont of Ixodes pacificus]KJW03390.1 TPR repeat family protein [Rickettsia endosymbiont of Ixodes pacificus]
MKNFLKYLRTIFLLTFTTQSLANKYLSKADNLFGMSKFDLALKEIDKAIELEPNNHHAYFVKSIILTKLGENKLALKASNNAINLDPKNSKYYWLKFMILEKLGEYKLASEAFDKYKALEQKFPQDIILTDKGEYKLKKEEALNALIEGNELNKLGKHKEALKTFEKLLH